MIERFFQGLSVAVETMRIIEELVEIWLNEVCDKDNLKNVIQSLVDIYPFRYNFTENLNQIL